MQGISINRHGLLVDALLQMERLFSDEQKECSFLQQADYCDCELKTMYWNYELLLKELLEQIVMYGIVYSVAKVQFMDRKLKELKKEIDRNTFQFSYVETDTLFKNVINTFGEFMKLPPLVNDYLTLRMYVIMIYKNGMQYARKQNANVVRSNLKNFTTGESTLVSVTDWFYDQELLTVYYIQDLSTAFR